MGINDAEANSSEFPCHKVDVPEYCISKYPVTVAQFRAFVEDSKYNAGNDWQSGVDNHPVEYISWDDAVAYCKWLSGKLKEIGFGEIRLPAEAEWEKAARGTIASIYPWGNALDINKMNSSETGIGSTSPVGCFPGSNNPYGLLDMNGNVWEWCLDWYDDVYYSNSPKDNPQGPSNGSDRALRGGSWAYLAWYCRPASRFKYEPDSRLINSGFRLVLARSVVEASRQTERSIE